MRVIECPVINHRVIDGDSIEVLIDLGFCVHIKQTCRIFGVDTPERHTEAGKAVKAIVENELKSRELICFSHSLDKYAKRFVGQIKSGEFDLGLWLLSQELAKPYTGGRKQRWTQAELDEVLGRCERVN